MAEAGLSADAELLRAEELLAERRVQNALQAFNAAERAGADPDRCAGGRWTAWMLWGDFAAAWSESDHIRRRGNPDPHRLWNGESPEGKRVIVRCLRGFGDAVQMLRFLPALRRQASHVIVEVAPDLVELARCFRGADEVITWGVDAPQTAPQWHLQLELMELPYLLRPTVADLPGFEGATSIDLPAEEVARAAEIVAQGGRHKVGLVSAASDWDPRRSLQPAEVEPLLEGTDAEFWCLDRHGGLRGDRRLRNVRDECGDGMMRLAAAIANLDLVITVDTLSAHLAGALGKPVWVMLQYAADWRWMLERADSPWYPTMRLFRQQQPGEWAGVVRAVGEALREL